MLFAIYYVGVLALIGVGAALWSTGHGTGDPYLSIGFVLALAPAVVFWLRGLFRRD